MADMKEGPFGKPGGAEGRTKKATVKFKRQNTARQATKEASQGNA